MVHIGIWIASRTGIEMPTGTGEIWRIAAADRMNVHAVHARGYTLQVIHNLNEPAVRNLILVEFDRSGNFLAVDGGRCFLNDVLIDRHASSRSAGASALTTTAPAALTAATAAGRWSRCLPLCSDDACRHAQHDCCCDRLCV